MKERKISMWAKETSEATPGRPMSRHQYSFLGGVHLILLISSTVITRFWATEKAVSVRYELFFRGIISS